jgi:hypothetical protein
MNVGAMKDLGMDFFFFTFICFFHDCFVFPREHVQEVKAWLLLLKGEAIFSVPPHPGGEGYCMGMPFPSNRSKSRHGDSAIL